MHCVKCVSPTCVFQSRNYKTDMCTTQEYLLLSCSVAYLTWQRCSTPLDHDDDKHWYVIEYFRLLEFQLNYRKPVIG